MKRLVAIVLATGAIALAGANTAKADFVLAPNQPVLVSVIQACKVPAPCPPK